MEKPSPSLSWASQAFPLASLENQQRLKGDDAKESSNIVPTFCCPDCVGCVPSLWKSECGQMRPSERGIRPSAHRYGPHDSHGTLL